MLQSFLEMGLETFHYKNDAWKTTFLKNWDFLIGNLEESVNM